MSLDQLNALEVTGQENASIVSLINLQEAMGAIGPAIFMKEFHIADITAPRPARTKKFLKFIANFMLYARNKKEHMQLRIDEVLSQASQLQNIRKEKEEMVERMNNKVRETGLGQSEIEKLEREIKERESKIAANKIQIEHKEKLVKEASEVKVQKVARNQTKRLEIQKLQDVSDQLNAKIVASPDRVKSELKNLEDERKNQEEQRENTQIRIIDTKSRLQMFESALTFIKKEHSKLKEVIEEQQRLNTAKKESDRLKGDIEEAVRAINLEEKLGTEEDQPVAIEAIKQCERDCQERLDKLQKICNDLDVDKKVLERKSVDMENRYSELYTETSKIRGKVGQVENEIANFLKQSQELYDYEIAKIEKLHKTIDHEAGR